MKTTYLTSVSTRLSPFSPHAKAPRLILSLLPPNARTRMAVKTTLLPRSAALTQPATLKLGFRDGKTMEWTWLPRLKGKKVGGMEVEKRPEEVKVKDVVEEVERHYRGLARKEELAG